MQIEDKVGDKAHDMKVWRKAQGTRMRYVWGEGVRIEAKERLGEPQEAAMRMRHGLWVACRSASKEDGRRYVGLQCGNRRDERGGGRVA